MDCSIVYIVLNETSIRYIKSKIELRIKVITNFSEIVTAIICRMVFHLNWECPSIPQFKLKPSDFLCRCCQRKGKNNA